MRPVGEEPQPVAPEARWWLTYECTECGALADVRVTLASASADPLVVRCPQCGVGMVYEARWPADADGYGSRSEGRGPRALACGGPPALSWEREWSRVVGERLFQWMIAHLDAATFEALPTDVDSVVVAAVGRALAAKALSELALADIEEPNAREFAIAEGDLLAKSARERA